MLQLSKPSAQIFERRTKLNHSLHRRPLYIRFAGYLPLLCVLATLLSGCSRSVRQDATQVAQIGSATSGQLAQIYEAAQEDVTDTFELNQFFAAYANPNPRVELTDTDRELLSIMQQTNRALGSRVRLARAMKQVYDSYGRLSDYNNAADMDRSVGELIGALNGAAAFPLASTAGPAAPAARAIGSTASDLLRSIASEIGTVRQNRALIREGKRLIPLLERLKTVFDAERKLLANEAEFPDVDPATGQPRLDAQGRPRTVMVRGIAGERVTAYKRVYQSLVSSNAVVSQALLNRFLAKSSLRWPNANQPFTDDKIKAGVIRLIEIEAYQRGKASDTAGEEVIRSLDTLITLHRELANNQSLSLQEALEQSALTQFWIGELNKKDIPTDSIIDLIQAVQKLRGEQP
jgi:hypothetical protein